MLCKNRISGDYSTGSKRVVMNYNYVIVILRMMNIYLIVMYVVILTTTSMTYPNVMMADEVEILSLLQSHDAENNPKSRKQHKDN